MWEMIQVCCSVSLFNLLGLHRFNTCIKPQHVDAMLIGICMNAFPLSLTVSLPNSGEVPGGGWVPIHKANRENCPQWPFLAFEIVMEHLPFLGVKKKLAHEKIAGKKRLPSNFSKSKISWSATFPRFSCAKCWKNTVAKTRATRRSRRANGDDLHGGDLDDTSDTPGGVLGMKGGCGTGNQTTQLGGVVFRNIFPQHDGRLRFFFAGVVGGQLIRGVLLARSPKPQKANLWWKFLKVAGARLSNIHNFCDIPNWLVNSINYCIQVYSPNWLVHFPSLNRLPKLVGCNVALSCRTCRWNPPAKHLIRRPFPSCHGGLKEGAVLQKSGPTDLGWHLFLGFYLCQLWVLCLVFVAAVGDTLPRAQWVKGHGDSFLRKVGCFWENIWIPV